MSPSATTPQRDAGYLPVSNGGAQRVGETLAILGCGVMGTAILLGVLSAKASPSKTDGVGLLPGRFRACVRRPESADSIRSALPPQALDSSVSLHTGDNVSAVREADMILLACQPHLFKPILAEHGMAAALRGKPIMSVLAGVTSEDIESYLEDVAADDKQASDSHDHAFSVIRVMPNIASAVQASSTVIEVRPPQHQKPLPGHFIATARAIFSCVGAVFTTQPDTFSICTTLNGSTPAFFAMVIDGLVDGAVALGLSHKEATQMAAATMRGTAELILSGKATYDVRYEVACPGGSTIQGLRTLEEARTRAVWMDAMRASTSEQSSLGEGLKVQRGSA
ncbi:putative pyrroline-5-carboxylate reductase [Rosellinia necatrix]|uniref:Putative pyrroline-5-carboxylate reductase n=1 Tax=Rosellinia necatrix TaxID=77044 RepID=A0A1W2TWG9_ROSNE|nr:putative pyrroline-5-carboxylate reductase [Rosellinia necatrix]